MGIQNRLNDNIIPVIHLMVKKEISHTEAFKEMAFNLGITTQSVLDSCVRRVGLRFVKEFSDLVRTNRINNYLKMQYPECSTFLDKEL
jgi:hypothetical protein